MSDKYNLLVSVNSILLWNLVQEVSTFTSSKVKYSSKDDNCIEIVLWMSRQNSKNIEDIIDVIISIESQSNYSEYRFDLQLSDIVTRENCLALVFELKLNRIEE